MANFRTLLRNISDILKLNVVFFLLLSELIEELVRAIDLKFDMRVRCGIYSIWEQVLISNRNLHPSQRTGDKCLDVRV